MKMDARGKPTSFVDYPNKCSTLLASWINSNHWQQSSGCPPLAMEQSFRSWQIAPCFHIERHFRGGGHFSFLKARTRGKSVSGAIELPRCHGLSPGSAPEVERCLEVWRSESYTNHRDGQHVGLHCSRPFGNGGPLAGSSKRPG